MEIRLNLLPENKKEEIAQAKRFRSAVFLEVEIFVIILVFLAFLFSINYILSLETKFAEDSINQDSGKEQYKVVKQYEENFSTTNSKTADLGLINKDQLYWSNMFQKLSNLTMDGVSISSMSTKNFSIIITGVSSTRDELIAFKDKLSTDKCFSNVDLPLSDLVSKDNVNFQINLNINRDCLNQ